MSLSRIQFTLPLRLGRNLLFWMPNDHSQRILGERLRLALQEPSPVWIKFSQILSTHRDLFLPPIADQLAMLQYRVQPFDGALARAHIERSMGQQLEAWFDDFQQEALASASITQVHTTQLKNDQEMVIKVIRQDILPMIKVLICV